MTDQGHRVNAVDRTCRYCGAQIQSVPGDWYSTVLAMRCLPGPEVCDESPTTLHETKDEAT